MRDLDRYDKRNVMQRIDRRETRPDGSHSAGNTLLRLFVLLLFLFAMGWGMWELSQPANVWIMQHEIRRTESDVRMIHEDAERARQEMAAPTPLTIETLIYQCLNEGYELTDQERIFVKNRWSQFLFGSKIENPEGILFRMRMCYDEDGNVVDIPLDEWKKQKEEYEIERKRDVKAETARAILEENAHTFVEKENVAENKRAKVEDKEKHASYQERSNRQIIRDIANEVNESFFNGDSPYSENEDAEDMETLVDTENTESTDNPDDTENAENIENIENIEHTEEVESD